jgi:UDP-N-acetylglucosamine--N-acetylmuramyl-(pentapeptide) pyrophosphoryl-undecaprenol N-acetylglucosamine transferase
LCFTGGYVSLPTCLAAALQRRAVVIQEQNAYAGLANRLLGLFAAAVFVAFGAAKKYFPSKK